MASRKDAAAETKTPAPAKAPKPPVEKDTQNGVTRPKAGTATGKVWEHADSISKKNKAPAKRGEVIEACTADGINASTAATQYSRWRVYNGLGKEEKAAASE